jgi:hypothetical protein
MQPGTLFGPALSKAKLAPGNQIIYDLITGQYSALVDLSTLACVVCGLMWCGER